MTRTRNILSSSVVAALMAMISMPCAAEVTIDFDPGGELASQFTIFSGSQYGESASGGLISSVGVTLANLQVSTFDGTQSESMTITSTGDSITVGAFIKFSSFGTASANGLQTLRLGVTKDGPDNFSGLPFATLAIVDSSSGTFRFLERTAGVAQTDSTIFPLSTGAWYYMESTFTYNGTDADYNVQIANADNSGAIGSVIHSWSFTGAEPNDEFTTGATLYAGFKGHTAFDNGAAAVIDNFYVSNAGVSQVPAVPDFKIVSYTRDSGTGESTIVFRSELGADYSLLGGEDLTNLPPVILSIPGTGGDVPVTHTPAGNPPKFFYRVRRN